MRKPDLCVNGSVTLNEKGEMDLLQSRGVTTQPAVSLELHIWI